MAVSKYERYLVRHPIREGNRPGTGFTNPALAYLSNDQVPGCNVFMDYRWYYQMPQPNYIIPEHAHEYDEIVLHIGSDPQNPEDLGGEIEAVVEGESLIFSETAALYLPKGIKHGPFIWKKFTKPHIQIAIVLGGGSIVSSKPGGRTEY